jgi:hypothetical protein
MRLSHVLSDFFSLIVGEVHARATERKRDLLNDLG